MDAEFLSVVSTALRMFLLGSVNSIIVLNIAAIMMRKRHSLKPACLWMLFRHCFINGGIMVILKHYFQNQSWWDLFYSLVMLTVLVGGYIAYYYTYEGTLAKNLAGIYIAEIIFTPGSYGTVALVNFLEGRPLGAIIVELMPLDFLAPFFAVLYFMVIRYFLTSVLSRFQDYELRFSNVIVWGISSINMIDYFPGFVKNSFNIVTMTFFLGFIILCIVAVSMLKSAVELNRETAFLKEQQRMMEYHYVALQDQMGRFEDYQKMVDKQMEAVENRTVTRKDLSEYIDNLKQEYAHIWAGIYCSDRMIDAVLYTQTEKLKRQHMELQCSLNGYDRGKVEEKDLAQILLKILSWAAKEAEKLPEDRAGRRNIELRMGSVMNQMMIECRVPAARKNQPSKSMLHSLIKKYDGKMDYEFDGEKSCLNVMLVE